jgi:ferredoxin-type protein NapF
MSACPAHLLLRDPRGYPEISFQSGACTFCGKCAEACATGALARVNPEQRPWQLTARIEPGCLALQRVECRVCGESCPAAAIRFVLAPRRVAQPMIVAERCTGCGACASLCPAAAIRIEQHLMEAATA